MSKFSGVLPSSNIISAPVATMTSAFHFTVLTYSHFDLQDDCYFRFAVSCCQRAVWAVLHVPSGAVSPVLRRGSLEARRRAAETAGASPLA